MIRKQIERVLERIYKRREMDSERLRSLYERKHGVQVGLYSYGCFDPRRFPRGMKIGRYCSFSQTCWFFSGNHGIDYLTTHPFLYAPEFGVVESERISRQSFVVEDDVWVGHNVVVVASANRIGRGAVVAAGTIVTKDVPRYSVFAGNPGRVVRFRFPSDVVAQIEASRWWEWSKEHLRDQSRSNPALIFSPTNAFQKVSASDERK